MPKLTIESRFRCTYIICFLLFNLRHQYAGNTPLFSFSQCQSIQITVSVNFFPVVLADANFPVSSICKCGPMEVRADSRYYFMFQTIKSIKFTVSDQKPYKYCFFFVYFYYYYFYIIGVRIPELLEAILKLFPLDSYVECPVSIAVLWFNYF